MVGEAQAGRRSSGARVDRTGFVPRVEPQAGQVDVGAAGRSQTPGPGSWALLCRCLVGTTSYPGPLGELPVPHPEFSKFEEVQARAKSCSELLTVGSGQHGGSTGGGGTVETACLCARVNLISVGKRRGWEGFEKGSDGAHLSWRLSEQALAVTHGRESFLQSVSKQSHSFVVCTHRAIGQLSLESQWSHQEITSGPCPEDLMLCTPNPGWVVSSPCVLL